MIQTTSQKIVVVLGTLVVLLLLGYFMFNNASIPVVTADLPEGEIKGQDILDLAYKIETIAIDQSVFSSSVFKSLIDYEIPLTEEPQGRPNPFALIGSDGGTVVSTTKTTSSIPN